jgi:hypothetical protein
MALAGNAFLALWNDIARSREPEYDRWHTQEHVPERVAVTGFLGARRYVNRGRENHRYFTLYDVADPRGVRASGIRGPHLESDAVVGFDAPGFRELPARDMRPRDFIG